jgi:hypothetical protein
LQTAPGGATRTPARPYPGTNPCLVAFTLHHNPSGPGPGRKPGDWDSYPPVSICPVRKFFQKILPDKFGDIPTAPGVMGPRAARISNGFWVEGLAGAGRLTEYPSESVTRLLRRHNASTQGFVQDWRRCSWRCFRLAKSAGEGRQHHETISFRQQLPVSALFARILLYERYR